MGAEDVLQH